MRSWEAAIWCWEGTASQIAEKLTNAWNTVEERRFSAA